MRPRRTAHTLPRGDIHEDGPQALPPAAARVPGAGEEAPGPATPGRDGPTQRRNDLPPSEGAARLAPASSSPLRKRTRPALLNLPTEGRIDNETAKRIDQG